MHADALLCKCMCWCMLCCVSDPHTTAFCTHVFFLTGLLLTLACWPPPCPLRRRWWPCVPARRRGWRHRRRQAAARGPQPGADCDTAGRHAGAGGALDAQRAPPAAHAAELAASPSRQPFDSQAGSAPCLLTRPLLPGTDQPTHRPTPRRATCCCLPAARRRSCTARSTVCASSSRARSASLTARRTPCCG